jgi:hypothetical protein
MLEDHLYDDVIGHSCKQEDLFASLTKLSCNPWRQRAEGRPFMVQPLKPEQAVKCGKTPKSFEASKNIMARPA